MSSEDSLYVEAENGKSSVAGTYDEDGPIVELFVQQVIPAGTALLDGNTDGENDRERKARIGLRPDDARQISEKLSKMANKLEENND